MAKEVFDNELDDYLDSQEEKYTCSECDKEISTESGVCSQKCHEASMI